MTLRTNDRVGLYTVLIAGFGVVVQALIHKRDGAIGWQDMIFALAIVAALGPYLLALPASWRREVSDHNRSQFPKASGLSTVIAVLLAPALFHFRGFEPRTGLLLIVIGLVNLSVYRLVAGQGAMSSPSKWSRLTFGSGACVGFLAALIEIDLELILVSSFSYGLYVFASHWLIRSIIDQPATRPTSAT